MVNLLNINVKLVKPLPDDPRDHDTLKFSYGSHTCVLSRRLDGWAPRIRFVVDGVLHSDFALHTKETVGEFAELWRAIDTKIEEILEDRELKKRKKIFEAFNSLKEEESDGNS